MERTMHRLDVPYQRAIDSLRIFLEEKTGKSVALTVTNNTHTLLSFRAGNAVINLRMHWMFLHADADVKSEIAEFIGRKKRRTPLIRRHIRQNAQCIRTRTDKKNHKPSQTSTPGRFHDIGRLFRTLNETYFGGRVSATIRWGRKQCRRSVRRRILGSFSSHTNTIVINPILDRKDVPDFFVRYIVYHEMLHSVLPTERKNGRRRLHGPAFREQERKFSELEAALEWEKNYFSRR